MNRLNTRTTTTAALTLGIFAFAASGCATKSYVAEQVDASSRATEAKLAEVQRQVETNQSDVATLQRTDQEQSQRISELSTTARDALERARAAGKLAEGKFLWETVLTDDAIQFPFNSAQLTDEAKSELATLAEKLKSENHNVYLEIQGFTDTSGDAAYNLQLAEKRAEAVRRYLNTEQGVPLHRMNVISYGEANPIADNSTREGRARNRRVAVVVMG
jgi:peptidoglycan-associated lipoprotein